MAQNESKKIDHERLKIALDAWKHSVTVQMHFNDIEMKVRNLYFTILAASLGLIGVVQGKRIRIPFPELSISLTMFVLVAAIFITLLFYFIDRHWYHRLLQGSVAHCIAIEELYGDQLPEIRMGKEISKQSPVELNRKFWKILFFFVRDPRFRKGSKLHSDQKIQVLYLSVVWAFAIVTIFYGLIGGIRIGEFSIIEFLPSAIDYIKSLRGN
jgi:hypothetical protein